MHIVKNKLHQFEVDGNAQPSQLIATFTAHRKQVVTIESNGRQRSVVRVHRGTWSRAAGRTTGIGRCSTGRHSAVAVPSEGFPGGGGYPGTRSSGMSSVHLGIPCQKIYPSCKNALNNVMINSNIQIRYCFKIVFIYLL